MTTLRVLHCSRCGKFQQQDVVNGLAADPAGWSVLSLSGLPMLHAQLCALCAIDIRDVLATPLVTPSPSFTVGG